MPGEWEQAAQGGSANPYPWGNAITHWQANFAGTPEAGAPDFRVGSEPYTSPVASYMPNSYGLFDIVGNLFEWTAGSIFNSESGSFIWSVTRGGSWNSSADMLTCVAGDYTINFMKSCPWGVSFEQANTEVGFRCVKDR